MNIFELFAKLSLDSSGFEKDVEQASNGFDELGDSAAEVSADTAKAEKAIGKLADAVAEATDDTHGMSAAAQANANKVKVLGARYEQSKEEVERLRKELNESVEKTGEASDETMVLADKLAKAEKECQEYADGLKELQDALDGVSDKSDSASDSLLGAVVKGNLLSGAITGLWDVVKGYAQEIWNMDEATEEFRVAQGKLNTAFETSGYSVETASTVFKGFYALLGDTDTAAEASQLLAQLGTNAQDMSTWVDIATGVYGTFGDALPINGLIEAANETSKVGQVTGVLAGALNWVGISEDEFNAKLAQCATTEERTALITDTLSAKYRDATATFRENNETVMAAREANLKLQEAQARVGEQTSRLKTALSTALAPAMQTVLGWVEKLSSGLADVAERWADYVTEIHKPLKTDSVEDAKAQLEGYKQELAETIELMTKAGADGAAMFGFKIAELNTQIEGAEAQIAEMEGSTESATEGMTEAAEAADTLATSTAGVTVDVSGMSLSLEEATERLNTYTNAATNMFSKIGTESELSYEQAIANMQHNIDATNAFGENMTAIAEYLPHEMADMFAAGGPEMYAGVVAMLAEANAGADVGLTQLNELYAEGGLAAANAFVQANTEGMTVDADNPVSVMAQNMENDTSMEEAGVNAVDKTASQMQSKVLTAGFDTAGSNAMQKFIEGMNNKRGEIMNVASSIANEAVARINAALAAAASGSYGGSSYRAGGLDYVPYNGYPSVLHRGEAVLTADEADSWRRGRSSGGVGDTVINQYISVVPQTPAEFADATLAMFEQARWA